MSNNGLSPEQMTQLVDLENKYDVSGVPENLYHYTKYDAVNLILSSEGIVFRLTEINSFPDITEGKLIHAYYETALHNLLNNTIITADEYDRLICIDVPETTLIISDNKTGSCIECCAYVACFSTIGQDPYMYDNYIKNEGHVGYCLQIPSWIFKSKFISHEIPIGYRQTLSPVVYGNSIIEIIESFLIDAKKICVEFSSEVLVEAMNTIMGSLLSKLRPITKLERYRKENEVRLIIYLPKSSNNKVTYPDFINEVENDKNHIKICFDKHLYGLTSHNVSDERNKELIKTLQDRDYQNCYPIT